MKQSVVVNLLILASVLFALQSSGQQTPTESPLKTLRFEPATIGYADEDEITPGCVGVLELSSTFSWQDLKDCWAGPDVEAQLSDVESVGYEIWDLGTSLTVKLKTVKRPLLLGVRNIPAIKIYRFLRKYSPSTKQRCTTGALNSNFEKSLTSISCDSWGSN